VECVWWVNDPKILQLKVQVVPVVAHFTHLQICTCIGSTVKACLGSSADVEAASFIYHAAEASCQLVERWRYGTHARASTGLETSVLMTLETALYLTSRIAGWNVLLTVAGIQWLSSRWHETEYTDSSHEIAEPLNSKRRTLMQARHKQGSRKLHRMRNKNSGACI